MKKLVIIALSLCTFIGLAQEGKKEAMTERLTKRKEQSPENRAEIETKQLALKLDLSKNQQSVVRKALLDHHTEGNAKMLKNKEAIKSMSEEERHKFKLEFLDAQIALKEKMKGILNAEQYTKYSQMMDRKMKSRRGKGKRKK